MRTAVKKTDVYKFDELSEEAKDLAIEKLYDINMDYEWWDYDGILPIDCKYDNIYFDLDRNQYLQFIGLTFNDKELMDYLGIPYELAEKTSYYFVNKRDSNTVINFEYIPL